MSLVEVPTLTTVFLCWEWPLNIIAVNFRLMHLDSIIMGLKL
jgi:hypothetical protein